MTITKADVSQTVQTSKLIGTAREEIPLSQTLASNQSVETAELQGMRLVMMELAAM